MTPQRPLTRPALVAGFALLSLSCLEPPVTERVDLRFLARGEVAVTTFLRIAVGEGDEHNQVLKQRLAEVRRDLLDGRDAWSRRFEVVEPDAERIVFEKTEGLLEKSIHHGLLREPRKLSRFFSDTPVHAAYGSGEGWAELILNPGSADRATRAQRESFKSAKAEWSSAVAEYLAAVRSLYAHLEDHPERAETCFGKIFDVFLSEEAKRGLADPSEDEEPLLKAVEEGMAQVTAVFSVDEGQAYSLEELSRLVHDPFPAPVRVQVPGKALEVEGYSSRLRISCSRSLG